MEGSVCGQGPGSGPSRLGRHDMARLKALMKAPSNVAACQHRRGATGSAALGSAISVYLSTALSFLSVTLSSSVSPSAPLPSPSHLVHHVFGAGTVSHGVVCLQQKDVTVSVVDMNLTSPQLGGEAGCPQLSATLSSFQLTLMKWGAPGVPVPGHHAVLIAVSPTLPTHAYIFLFPKQRGVGSSDRPWLSAGVCSPAWVSIARQQTDVMRWIHPRSLGSSWLLLHVCGWPPAWKGPSQLWQHQSWPWMCPGVEMPKWTACAVWWGRVLQTWAVLALGTRGCVILVLPQRCWLNSPHDVGCVQALPGC